MPHRGFHASFGAGFLLALVFGSVENLFGAWPISFLHVAHNFFSVSLVVFGKWHWFPLSVNVFQRWIEIRKILSAHTGPPGMGGCEVSCFGIGEGAGPSSLASGFPPFAPGAAAAIIVGLGIMSTV